MDKKINEILTDIRKESKLSRKGMQELSGFKASTIESYERGTRKPSKEYIEFMSLYFGYKKEYIEGKNQNYTKLIKGIQTILIYQSIYNYDDIKMAQLLNISLEEYKKLLDDDISGASFDIVINIAKKLNIRFDCISYFTILDEISTTVEDNFYLKHSKFKEFYRDIKLSMSNKNDIESLNKNGINITPEYYATIIKKRNSPKDNYTPNDESKEIPPKHKEILDLLPYAPDSFKDTIIDKLRIIKDSQVL